MSNAVQRVIDALNSQQCDPQRSGDGWSARCPAHDDQNPSLSVREGDDGKAVLHCHAGCGALSVIGALGLGWADLYSENGRGFGFGQGEFNIVAEYDYVDEDGTLLYQVVRLDPLAADPKPFRQRRPDIGGWTWKLGDVRRVLYRLPEAVAAAKAGGMVFVVEGEKDADRLASLGLTATTSPGGAANGQRPKWRDEYSESLRGVHAFLVPDNDGSGRAHMQAAAKSLHGIAASVRIVELPHLPAKGDVSDWLDAGHTLTDLLACAKDAPLWTPDVAPVGAPPPAPAAKASAGRDYSHDGLARELGEHWPDARHVAAWGKWLFCQENGIWKVDPKLEHMTRARDFLLAKEEQAAEEGEERKLRSAAAIGSVVGLARSNVRQAAVVEQWDADPWLLGTPDGTIDLHTGEARPTEPHDYITKAVAVTPAPRGTSAELFTKFLAEIIPDEATRAYLQRFLGYALTGLVTEHVFVFAHGTGANGKGVLLRTVQGILGGYALTIPTEMLMESRNERHPTELARLRGVRLAVGSEVEDGARWAESKIKALTGGDRIAARFMRQDFFEFDPQFKLIIAGNKQPSLRGVDEAIKRRIHLVPFTVTIPEPQRDKDLAEKLKDEWPAILRWMIEGCLTWQRHDGLDVAQQVRDATEQYLAAEDVIEQWMSERCEKASSELDSAAGVELYQDWTRFAERHGEKPGTQTRFGRLLDGKGYPVKRIWRANEAGARRQIKVRVGLRILKVEQDADDAGA